MVPQGIMMRNEVILILKYQIVSVPLNMVPQGIMMRNEVILNIEISNC